MSAADDEIGRFTEYSVHHQMIYSITKRPRPGDEGHGLEQLHTLGGLIVLVLTWTSFRSGSALFQTIELAPRHSYSSLANLWEKRP